MLLLLLLVCVVTNITTLRRTSLHFIGIGVQPFVTRLDLFLSGTASSHHSAPLCRVNDGKKMQSFCFRHFNAHDCSSSLAADISFIALNIDP